MTSVRQLTPAAMSDARSNTDELPARVQTDETVPRRGRLKVFFGYAAGVGKTHAMLEAARRSQRSGVDVVVGCVEIHGRPEMEVLLEGLEQLPPRWVSHGGVTLREFDVDSALARKPQLILVDELAHTNVPGSRHARRWQDIEELLNAGIDVCTTVNVQHLESLNDVIAQITGVVVRETLPDLVIERADEIELIDLTPEELLERLKAGKVCVSQHAMHAVSGFFQRPNLIALRELSLRQTAQRLSQDVNAARKERADRAPWATSERLLVCVGPSPTSAKLIRAAKRMAAAFDAEWLAVAVQRFGADSARDDRLERVAHHMRLAERLGAETHTLIGDDVPQTLLDFAHSRNVTKIVVGKTGQPRWKRLLFGTVVDALVDRSGSIDVYAIRGEAGSAEARPHLTRPVRGAWGNYARTALVVALCGLLGWVSHYWRLAEANIVMVLLLGVAYAAARYGRGPAIVAAIASVLLFDFWFVPPFLTLSVDNAQYLLTFAVMLFIGVVISTLTTRIRDQLLAAQQTERRTSALFRLTRQLSQVAGSDFLTRIAGRQLREIFDGEIVLFVRERDGSLAVRFGQDTATARNETNVAAAHWVAEHDEAAGTGTDTLRDATAFFVPLLGFQRTQGAVGVRPNDPTRLLDPEQRRLLETCASLIALSLERDQSVLNAHESQLQVQAEQLRNSLLSSMSHDLRTPLAAMAGAASSLLDDRSGGDPAARQLLLQTVVDESHRLARLVDNLLDMTRLESGAVALNRQWHVMEEIVGSALSRLRRELASRPVRVESPADLPLLFLDGMLMEQVFVNLLENALRYTPADSPIEIVLRSVEQRVEIRFSDYGPGLPSGCESRVFEKFFRGATSTADGRRGVGLGLAICKAIIEAHGGRIRARNRLPCGAEFRMDLPCDTVSPCVTLEEPDSGVVTQA